MGNTNSAVVPGLNTPVMLPRINLLSVDYVLDKLSYQTVLQTSYELQESCDLWATEKLVALAENIYERSIANQSSSLKYVELAKELSEFEVYLPGEVINFKDVFIAHAMNEFEFLKRSANEYGIVHHEKIATAAFFGNLYIANMVSSVLMCHWVKSLAGKEVFQNKILSIIKDKVVNDSKKPGHDAAVAFLKQLLRTRKMITEPVVTSPAAQATINFAQKQPAHVIIQPTVGAVPVEQRTVPPVPLFNQQPKVTPSTMPDNFRRFLANIQNNPKLKFDFQLFMSCSDADRYKCAKIMLEVAIDIPENAAAYAETTRTIITSASVRQQNHKIFSDHLGEICHEALSLHFKKGLNIPWNEVNNIGIFLSEVYVRQGLKVTLIGYWLEGVNKMIPQSSFAINTLLNSLKIMLQKLKSRDRNSYRVNMLQIQNLADQGKIPIHHQQWTSKALNNTAVRSSRSSSVSSSRSEASSSANVVAQRPTGAIPKQFPKVLSDTSKPTSTTAQICTNFQNLLNQTQNGFQVSFNCLNLESCSEAVLKGCALILVEHVALYPEKAKQYATATGTAILSQMWFAKQKNIFVKHLSSYFEAEMSKCLKAESPEKSNWDRIKNVGAFLGELFNVDVVGDELVKFWIEKIYQAVQMDCENAIKILLVFYLTVGVKMKKQEPNTFGNSYNFIHQILFIIENKFPAKYDELAAKAKLMMTVSVNPIKTQKNVFNTLQDVVHKVTATNHQQILLEIVSLQMHGTEENLRKFTTTLISRANQRPDVQHGITEILAKFPEASRTSISASTYRTQIKRSLTMFFGYLTFRKQILDTESRRLILLTKELHKKNAIGSAEVTEIMEELAIGALNNGSYPLQLLLDFIKCVAKDISEVDREVMKITRNALTNHSKKPPGATKNAVNDAMLLLFPNRSGKSSAESSKLTSTSPKINGMPKQSTNVESNPTIAPKTEIKFAPCFTDLAQYDIEEFILAVSILSIETATEMQRFIKEILDISLNNRNFGVFGRLVQIIDEGIQKKNLRLEVPFKESLVDQVQADFYLLLSSDNTIPEICDQAKALVMFNAELYRIGWIDGKKLSMLIDTLMEKNIAPNEQLDTFHYILQATSTVMIKNDDGSKCAEYKEMLTEREPSYKRTRSYLMYIDTLDILDNIMVACKRSSHLFHEKQIKSILHDISSVTESAEKVKTLLTTTKELKSFMDLYTKKAISDPNDALLCAKLAVELQELSIESNDDSENWFKYMLVDKCQELLLSNLNEGARINQLSETLGLLQFIGELYNASVLNYDFIHLCLELIADDSSDNAADCINILMRTVGEKANLENSEDLDEYFEKFEEIVKSESSYRSESFKELIEMRNNEWVAAAQEIRQTDLSEMAETMEGLLEKKLKSVSTRIEQIINEKNQINEFFAVLWKSVTKKSDKTAIHAKLCAIISASEVSKQGTTEFQEQLSDYLRRRNAGFATLKNEQYSESIQNQLANVMTFVAELYKNDIASDQTLECWISLKLTKHISLSSLTKLMSIVTPKINTSGSIRLKASIISIEHDVADRSSEIFKVLKDDIKDVTEIVGELRNKLNSAQHNEKVPLNIDLESFAK